jgi:DNA polymerase-3 subunit delta'
MLFKDVIGQQAIKHQLVEMVAHGRVSHALLFLNKEGSGALPLVNAFAQYMVCEKVHGSSAPAGPSLFGDGPQPAMNTILTDACGLCPPCQKAAQFAHPDIHYSYPAISSKPGDKPLSATFRPQWREFLKLTPYGNVFDWLQFIGAENKQGNISAEECNDIIKQLSLKTYESEYKILVMWMPEYLGKEGNKLLKLIEEPPPNTLFLLVAKNEELILQTILSRTQLIKIPTLEDNEVKDALVQRAGIDGQKAGQIASLAQGNYREALQLLQHAEEDWQAVLRDWLNAILKAGPVAQVKWVEEMAKTGREKQKQFLKYFTHLLDQSLRMRILGSELNSIADNEKDFAERLNKIASVNQQQAIIEELDKAQYYIERNANGKMLFHALTIKLLHIIKNKVLVTA